MLLARALDPLCYCDDGSQQPCGRGHYGVGGGRALAFWVVGLGYEPCEGFWGPSQGQPFSNAIALLVGAALSRGARRV